MAEKNGNGTAVWYVHRAKTLRISAKFTLNKLATLADVSRQTVTKIEKNHPVTEVVAEKLFSALNDAHDGKLNRDDHVKTVPFKG